MLVPVLDRLARNEKHLGFFLIVHKTWITICWPISRDVVVKRCTDLVMTSESQLLYRWRTGEMIGLADKLVRERKREVEGRSSTLNVSSRLSQPV